MSRLKFSQLVCIAAIAVLSHFAVGISQCEVVDTGPEMMPGEDCLSCHDGAEAPLFTAAGTVFESNRGDVGLPGVTVIITGAAGQEIVLESNAAGNFYTDEPIRMPFTAQTSYQGIENHMPDPQEYGGCNSCHSGLDQLAPHGH